MIYDDLVYEHEADIFANQQKFLDEYTKTVKAENLKGTPRPPAGSGSEGIDYAKKIEEAQTSGDMAAVAYYTRLQAHNLKRRISRWLML